MTFICSVELSNYYFFELVKTIWKSNSDLNNKRETINIIKKFTSLSDASQMLSKRWKNVDNNSVESFYVSFT